MNNEKIYEKLYNLLTEYNFRFNLTAIKGYEDYLVKHVRDSMLGLPYVNGRVLDIGSGAGFPALVLKTEKPELDVTMTDSVGKKVNYLSAVIDALGMTGIRAVHTRIEDLKDFGAYDTVTARAVARLAVLAEYGLPFVRTGGALVAYKAADCGEEIKEAGRAIKLLGGEIERTDEIKLTDDIMRTIIVVRKTSPSPKGYPRKGNKPRLSPLV